MSEKVVIGADHAGFKIKEHVKKFLIKTGYDVFDEGADKLDKNDDYPIYAFKVAEKVSKTDAKGILFCGSSEGVCIAANKIKGIRAVSVWSSENAKLSRQHNDANVLCLSGQQLKNKKAEKIILTWLKTKFSNHLRHKRRIKQILNYENECCSRN